MDPLALRETEDLLEPAGSLDLMVQPDQLVLRDARDHSETQDLPGRLVHRDHRQLSGEILDRQELKVLLDRPVLPEVPGILVQRAAVEHRELQDLREPLDNRETRVHQEGRVFRVPRERWATGEAPE